MAEPRPYHSEVLTSLQTQARLRQVSAHFKKQTASQQAYWSRSQKAWIIVESAGANRHRLTYYKSKACPC